MARRSGKAANRRSRQRPARRAAARTAPAPAFSAPATTETVAPAPTVTSAPEPAPTRATRPGRNTYAGVGSALAEAARAEYHYVGRDLRNMAILVVIIAVLMAAAVFAFHATGIVAS